MKKHAITISILISASLCSGNVLAREWFEKSCEFTGKDKSGNFYVGGSFNKYHMHVGTDFIHMYSHNNTSKPVTSGRANCALLDQAIGDVAGGGYEHPQDVTDCLIAAKANYGCP